MADVASTRRRPISKRASSRCWAPSARRRPTSTPPSRRSSPTCARAATPRSSIIRSDSTGSISRDSASPFRQRRSTPPSTACDPSARRRARIRPRARARLSPAPEAGRHVAFVDALGVELGWRWRADRRGRALRARRRGELSLLGADERRRRPRSPAARASSMVVPTPERQGQSAGAGRRAASPASTKSTASAARRRSPRSPMARRRSRRSPRSSAPATPMSPPPSGGCSAWSAST